MLDYILIGIVAVIIIFLLRTIYLRLNSTADIPAQRKKRKPVPTGPSYAHCPVCNTALPKGVNIMSKVYRPMNVPDQRCTINGCPYCYPTLQPGVKRTCPVCKKNVPVEGYLIARLFNKKDGSKHVHIVFCTECQRGGKK